MNACLRQNDMAETALSQLQNVLNSSKNLKLMMSTMAVLHFTLAIS